jgi:acetolactate synthase I/II/III large subunit
MTDTQATSTGSGSARRGYELLADAFVAEGVSVIFAIIGYGNRHFLAEAANRGIRVVTARHDGAALTMADGYSRAGSDVGVASVHYGPGVTQLPTSLMVASKHGTPVVAFAAGLSRDERYRGGPLDLDERSLLEASGARVVELVRTEQAVETVHRAFQEAREYSTPVALLAPIDLQEATVADAPEPPSADLQKATAADAPESPRAAQLRVGDHAPQAYVKPIAVPAQESLHQAVALLRQADRPLVLAGHGALDPEARALALDIADRTGALLATSFGAKGLFDWDPRSLGTSGSFSLPTDHQLLEQADCVLAVGVALNHWTTDRGRLYGAATVIHIDDDPTAFGMARVTPQLRLLGDATSTLSCLSRLLAESGPSAGWSQAVRDSLAGADARKSAIANKQFTVEAGTVDPRQFMLEMDRHLPEDAVVIVGGGHFMAFAMQYLRNPSARSFELVCDFMCIGQGIPAGVGAAVAAPDRPVVVIEGDASALMHIQELETAARSGIPLLVLVLNDAALGAEYHGLVGDGMRGDVALASTPALADVAAALGGAGMTVTSPEQASDIMTWYEPKRGPHLVDVRISRNVIGP